VALESLSVDKLVCLSWCYYQLQKSGLASNGKTFILNLAGTWSTGSKSERGYSNKHCDLTNFFCFKGSRLISRTTAMLNILLLKMHKIGWLAWLLNDAVLSVYRSFSNRIFEILGEQERMRDRQSLFQGPNSAFTCKGRWKSQKVCDLRLNI
jgi:hypothetical protein